jgi:hypothetical protein
MQPQSRFEITAEPISDDLSRELQSRGVRCIGDRKYRSSREMIQLLRTMVMGAVAEEDRLHTISYVRELGPDDEPDTILFTRRLPENDRPAPIAEIVDITDEHLLSSISEFIGSQCQFIIDCYQATGSTPILPQPEP